MKTKRALIIGIVVSTVAVALAAEVAQTHVSNVHLSFKQGPTLLKIKSGGEVVAELRLLKPVQLDIKGIEAPQTVGTLRTAVGGQIEITPDGLSPWRISGAGLEVETVQEGFGQQVKQEVDAGMIDDLVNQRIRSEYGDRATLIKMLQAKEMTFESFRLQVKQEILDRISKKAIQ